jgi:hypothetical protein
MSWCDTRTCPYCDKETYADFVDIGVGMQQVSPFTCECGAVQIGPYDKPDGELTADEKRTGWYAPFAALKGNGEG